jgi:3-phenylpropionate/trans-cinnamate dioxygenase ferredoxin reductase subunit
MDTPFSDVLIIGGGHGGAQAASALRQQKFAGAITLISAETDFPYERPPLSKDFLSGAILLPAILLRPEIYWAEKNIAVRLGVTIISIDAAERVATSAAGEKFRYGTLIWAGGGSPRRLTCPGADLAGVHIIRTVQDILRIAAELPKIQKIAVIGGGFIGLEAAAVLAKLGKSITVIEAQNRILARVSASPLAAFFQAEHEAHGVTFHLGVGVAGLAGSSRVTGVTLDDGTIIPAELVIVGIGISPEIGPLQDAGAACSNGVEVDEYCRTSLDDIYAIGDCALHENKFAGGAKVRIESVQNATDQASTAAKAIAGVPAPYETVPLFWSNQYDLRLQTIGFNLGYDDIVLRGDPASRAFTVVYLRAGRVIALDCVNTMRDYAQGRQLVLAQPVIDPALLADPALALKTLFTRSEIPA